jgi:hypothetical protein
MSIDGMKQQHVTDQFCSYRKDSFRVATTKIHDQFE